MTSELDQRILDILYENFSIGSLSTVDSTGGMTYSKIPLLRLINVSGRILFYFDLNDDLIAQDIIKFENHFFKYKDEKNKKKATLALQKDLINAGLVEKCWVVK